MDREITEKEKTSKVFRKWGIPILIIVGLWFAVQQISKTFQSTVDYNQFLIAQVVMGDIETSFNAQGKILPEKEISINAPITTQIKTTFHENGDKLNIGDEIISLDDQFLRLTYESQKDNLKLKKNNIKKSGYVFDKRIKDLENDSKIFALRIKEQKATLENLRILHQMGSHTIEDIKKAEVSIKIAELEKNKINDELEFQKQFNKIEKENLSLEVKISDKSLQELNTKLQNTTLKSPINGILMWINKNIGKQVQEGENIARIADLSSFKISGQCSDRYSNQLSIGSRVRFKTGNINITGVINNIDPTVENNQLKFDVTLDQASNENLRAYTKGELRIILDNKTNVKKIKRGLGITGAKSQDIWVIRGSEAIKTTVTVGSSNSEFIEIHSNDIHVGDKIIISDMKLYEKKSKIIINE